MDFLSLVSSIPPIAFIVLLVVIGIIVFEIILMVRRRKPADTLAPLESFGSTGTPQSLGDAGQTAAFSSTPTPPTDQLRTGDQPPTTDNRQPITGQGMQPPTGFAMATAPVTPPKKSRKNIVLATIAILMLTAAVPITLIATRQGTELRSRAAEPAPTIDFSNPNALQVALSSTKAQLHGMICEYNGTNPAGTVMAYDLDSKEILTLPLAADTSVYSMRVDPGRYALFFKPVDTTLPVYAYTKHSVCALGEYACGDHTFLIEDVQQRNVIGTVNICDSQYSKKGLPKQLK